MKKKMASGKQNIIKTPPLASIGIDIGGSKTLGLLANEKFEILQIERFKTGATEGQRSFLSKLTKMVDRFVEHAKRRGYMLTGVGVGCAGLIDTDTGTVKDSPNIQFLKNLPLGDLLEKRTKLPVQIGNDVQVGLYGEHQLGAAKGCMHVLGVFFGTGVGGALMINGKLHLGASGLGGQVGCLLAHTTGGSREAQSHGILDRVASKASIFGEAVALAAKHWAPYLHKRVGSDLSKMDWEILSESIQHGDKRIEALLRSRLHIVGNVLANVVNFASPEMVVLGGGLTEEMPRLVVHEIKTGMLEHLVPEVAKTVRIVAAKLKNQSVAYGAAKLAFNGTPDNL